MRITKVAPAAKTPGRYNIFIDGQYSFSLDELQLVQAGIHSGLEIDDEQLAKLRNESEFGKNYIRAIDLISRRLRSEKEIRDYARRKDWTPDNTDRVIDRLKDKGYLNDKVFAELKDKGYLNDKVFAETFVRSRQNAGKYSRRRIELDLRRKGIADTIIKEILHNEVDDTDALRKLIAKRAKRYDDVNKLKAYLLRAGFNYDDINREIGEYR